MQPQVSLLKKISEPQPAKSNYKVYFTDADGKSVYTKLSAQVTTIH